MSTTNSIRDAGPLPCPDCGHDWEDHTWQGGCLYGYEEARAEGRPYSTIEQHSCHARKGDYHHFGLTIRGGAYVRLVGPVSPVTASRGDES